MSRRQFLRCNIGQETRLLEIQERWAAMTPAQKKKQLFLNQKELLGKFVTRHAISQAQYDKSLGDLREKMGYESVR